MRSSSLRLSIEHLHLSSGYEQWGLEMCVFQRGKGGPWWLPAVQFGIKPFAGAWHHTLVCQSSPGILKSKIKASGPECSAVLILSYIIPLCCDQLAIKQSSLNPDWTWSGGPPSGVKFEHWVRGFKMAKKWIPARDPVMISITSA